MLLGSWLPAASRSLRLYLYLPEQEFASCPFGRLLGPAPLNSLATHAEEGCTTQVLQHNGPHAYVPSQDLQVEKLRRKSRNKKQVLVGRELTEAVANRGQRGRGPMPNPSLGKSGSGRRGGVDMTIVPVLCMIAPLARRLKSTYRGSFSGEFDVVKYSCRCSHRQIQFALDIQKLL